MSAYQAVAENGPEIFRGPEIIYPYPDNEALPKADGIMLLDSNFGNAAMQLFSLDPAVEDENSGKMINESLDLFSPENGFDPVYGARPLKRYIQKNVETILGRMILSGEVSMKDTVEFTADGGELTAHVV